MAPRAPEVAVAPVAKPNKPVKAAQSPESADHAERKDSQAPPQPSSKLTAPAPKAPPASQTSSPAVTALLQEAETSSASGSLDEAAAALERAIRIQPRNAKLWHKLAEARLKQHQPGLAEDLAKKSNVLAKDDSALTRQNWAIIADARRKKGDAEGAADADAKAGQ
jgi:tetratricopeptide (TPR) repeat protein